MVGVESESEEVAVGNDRRPADEVRHRAAVAPHLAVHQVHVEVRELHVVALRRLVAAACAAVRNSDVRRHSISKHLLHYTVCWLQNFGAVATFPGVLHFNRTRHPVRASKP